jgi:hypothetical protein
VVVLSKAEVLFGSTRRAVEGSGPPGARAGALRACGDPMWSPAGAGVASAQLANLGLDERIAHGSSLPPGKSLPPRLV